MNILTKAIDEIKYRIPPQVLQVAFLENIPAWRKAPISLDESMRHKVIKSRVLVDANLVGGQTIMVSLEGLSPSYIDTYTIVYEIPSERLMHRVLMSVLSVGYMPYASAFNSIGGGTGVVDPGSINDVLMAGQKVGDSFSSIPVISNASAEIIGNNTILLRDQLRVTNAYHLRCIVANETDLNNISPRSYLAFATLCELAIKSYIYNKLIIQIDNAYLTGGQELGALKSYVESLSDAEQNYQTFLQEKWRPTAFMNDQLEYTRFLKLQFSSAL